MKKQRYKVKVVGKIQLREDNELKELESFPVNVIVRTSSVDDARAEAVKKAKRQHAAWYSAEAKEVTEV